MLYVLSINDAASIENLLTMIAIRPNFIFIFNFIYFCFCSVFCIVFSALGVARNVNWGALHPPPFPLSFLLPFSFSLFLPFLEVKLSKTQLRGLGLCKLLQWGMGRSHSRNRIWCNVALKYDLWW